MRVFPDWNAFKEKIDQAKLNNDEEAMGRAAEEYAFAVRGSSQVLDSSKGRMIQEAMDYFHKKRDELDTKPPATLP